MLVEPQAIVPTVDGTVATAPGGARTYRADAPVRAFARAGPLKELFWDPAEVKAAIVTCGGLCPGLNTVVREVVMCLRYVYGVPHAWGIQNGYRGFYDGSEWLNLDPTAVSEIHKLGGTVLGSSRGGFDREKILDAVAARGVTHLFIVGGDGTHRGALALLEGATERGMRLCVAGVPKTIDNDIGLLDKSFGFDTAVEQATHPIACANVEATAAKNGVGLVKLMGRSAGFIAAFASMASRDVNLTLIPEADWRTSKVLEWLEARIAARGHAVIVVAEGAESLEQKEAKAAAAAAGAKDVRRDESGNVQFDDVGVYLKDAIGAHFKKAGKPINVKYIDPSYIIRSSPCNASDSLMCTHLAFNAVHGAMAGYTGFSTGLVNDHFCWLPMQILAKMPPRTIDVTGRLYARLCTTTGQPKLD